METICQLLEPNEEVQLDFGRPITNSRKATATPNTSPSSATSTPATSTGKINRRATDYYGFESSVGSVRDQKTAPAPKRQIKINPVIETVIKKGPHNLQLKRQFLSCQ